MESTRPAWNNARMNQFTERNEVSFAEVRTELKEEIQDLRTEMNERFGNLEGKIDRRSDIALGAMVTGFVGLLVTHFLG